MTEPIILDEDHLTPLHRHFINLNCIDSGDNARKQNGGNPAVYNFSAFIVGIQDEWLAITAGHIFRDLKDYVSRGASLSNWLIDDSAVSNSVVPAYPISLQIDQDVQFFYDEKEGYDYAYFPIAGLTRQALADRGIEAIPAATWDADDLNEFPFWLLVGTPIVFATLDSSRPLVKKHATVYVEEVDHVPQGLETTNFQRLYARIDFDSVAEQDGVFDIGGMSGGPIFGLRSLTASYDSYRLIGVQSGWNEKDHIALCAAQPFIRAIARVRNKHT